MDLFLFGPLVLRHGDVPNQKALENRLQVVHDSHEKKAKADKNGHKQIVQLRMSQQTPHKINKRHHLGICEQMLCV
jgi:hypothetical protein